MSLQGAIDPHLYERGFFLTNGGIQGSFFKGSDDWVPYELLDGFAALIHKDSKLYCSFAEGSCVFLIGHAYDPVRLISDENKMIGLLLAAESDKEFFEMINELSGIFVIGKIEHKSLLLVGDPAGMQTVFYGIHHGHVHVASHTHMFEDVCGVRFDAYVSRLVKYRFYPLFGMALPGDITPYQNFKRLIPNHYVEITGDAVRTERFFPAVEYRYYRDGEIETAEKRIAELMHHNLQLISQKWNKPAISMTGGCDSKTTLACAQGLYDKFQYFSYISNESERVDADAAHQLCADMGLQHKIYEIPGEDSAFPDIEKVRKILAVNCGNIGSSHENDVRKRAFFASIDDFDVEVKSWVSECGRAYYNKRFLKNRFPARPTPRYLTALYKVFLTDRNLVRETDKVFLDYIKQYLSGDLKNYPWQELFFWEFRMSSWNGLVITGEHKYSFDITIPYNNRMIVDMLLRMPPDHRMHDTAYREIRRLMNPEVDKAGISVINLKHTRNRAKLEKIYLDVMSRLPF